ncbi:MAG: hypothetical protein FJ344_06880 [Sphingomonadales bacterium]|nr:hypothetical protein [Sphingomonadales bacterium]
MPFTTTQFSFGIIGAGVFEVDFRFIAHEQVERIGGDVEAAGDFCYGTNGGDAGDFPVGYGGSYGGGLKVVLGCSIAERCIPKIQ